MTGLGQSYHLLYFFFVLTGLGLTVFDRWVKGWRPHSQRMASIRLSVCQCAAGSSNNYGNNINHNGNNSNQHNNNNSNGSNNNRRTFD